MYKSLIFTLKVLKKVDKDGIFHNNPYKFVLYLEIIYLCAAFMEF